jgi:hypothetical protein
MVIAESYPSLEPQGGGELSRGLVNRFLEDSLPTGEQRLGVGVIDLLPLGIQFSTHPDYPAIPQTANACMQHRVGGKAVTGIPALPNVEDRDRGTRRRENMVAIRGSTLVDPTLPPSTPGDPIPSTPRPGEPIPGPQRPGDPPPPPRPGDPVPTRPSPGEPIPPPTM